LGLKIERIVERARKERPPCIILNKSNSWKISVTFCDSICARSRVLLMVSFKLFPHEIMVDRRNWWDSFFPRYSLKMSAAPRIAKQRRDESYIDHMLWSFHEEEKKGTLKGSAKLMGKSWDEDAFFLAGLNCSLFHRRALFYSKENKKENKKAEDQR